MGALEDAVDAAAQFIKPYLDKAHDGRGVQKDESPPVRQQQLVEQALLHLHAIHKADKAKDPNAPYDASLAGVVYGLLDMVTILGILPSLSPGVAFSQRPRSVLVPDIPVATPPNHLLLTLCVFGFLMVFGDVGLGIQPLLTQRSLPDLISGLAELSFSPNMPQATNAEFRPTYHNAIRMSPISRLLPMFSSYLKHGPPTWFHVEISRELAYVPLRPHGVRHIIEFFSLHDLSQTSSGVQDPSGPRSQIPISVEAIRQASKLLAVAPSGMDANEWFSKLAPELLDLLDGKSGVEFSRAAGQVIGSAILARRSTGAPGAPGWELFGRPILEAISPSLRTSPPALANVGTPGGVYTADTDLLLAVKRLYALVSSNSMPGLLRRLVSPIILPLWGLLGYACSRTADGTQRVSHLEPKWLELPRLILSRYMAVYFNLKEFEMIISNLFWDGKADWTFGAGSEGGIEIRPRKDVDDHAGEMPLFIIQWQTLEARVDSVVQILSDADINDDVVSTAFLGVTRRSFSMTMEDSPFASPTKVLGATELNPLEAMSYAKISQGMSLKFKPQLARHPLRVMELSLQLLQHYIRHNERMAKGTPVSDKLSLSSLSNILEKHPTSSTSKPASIPGQDQEEEMGNMAAFALSLLHVTITTPEFEKTPRDGPIVSDILSSLQYLAREEHQKPLPPGVINAAENVLSLLSPSHDEQEDIEGLRVASREVIKAALSELTSTEPANRAWGLSELERIIQDPKASAFLDVPSATHAVLSTTLTGNESFVYGPGISVLVHLAAFAPNPVLRILVDAYIDIEENSLQRAKEEVLIQALNFRLRVGEVLNNFVNETKFWDGPAKVGNHHIAAKMIVEATLLLASRRGQRRKGLATRNELLQKEKKEQEEAEAAWDGPVPNIFPDEENEPVTEKQEREALMKILQGWESPGIEEDVRVRASALSILGRILEIHLRFAGQSAIDAALQMALTILALETGAAKAILRRAAVLVVMGFLKGLDSLIEQEVEITVNFGLRQYGEVERVMKWLRQEDNDDLVQTHAKDVLESLDILRVKQWFGAQQRQVNQDLGLDVEGGLRGLSVNPLGSQGGSKQKGGLVEELE